MASPQGTEPVPSAEQFRVAQSSAQFEELRRTHRSFVWPMAAAFLVWYVLFVVLGAYAHDFMSIRLGGNINLGLILGLLQFVTTFAITAAYVRFANGRLDPRATALRERLEAEAGRPVDAADDTRDDFLDDAREEAAR